jgi:hypothetical protein
MPLDPLPVNLVLVRRFVKALPQVLIFYRLLVRRFPATPLPIIKPFRNAFFHILRIGGERDLARAFQRLERLDRGHELHAVIRGLALGTVKFFFVIVLEQYRAPAPGTGIAATGTIGVYRNLVQMCAVLLFSMKRQYHPARGGLSRATRNGTLGFPTEW